MMIKFILPYLNADKEEVFLKTMQQGIRDGKLMCVQKGGKIACNEDWFALRDPKSDGFIFYVGHIDLVFALYEDGMEVAFAGRHHTGQDADPVDFPYTTRESLKKLKEIRESAYKRDIAHLGLISNEARAFYVRGTHLPIKAFDENTITWTNEIPPGVCLACENGKCWLHVIN